MRLRLCVVVFAVVAVGCAAAAGDTGYFWHITDMHFDRDYVVGSPSWLFCHPPKPSAGGQRALHSVIRGGDGSEVDWCAPRGEDSCASCQSLVCYAEQVLEPSLNETEFIEELDKLCALLGSAEAECKVLVERYGRELHLIFDIVEGYSMCRLVGACSFAAGPVADRWCSEPLALAHNAVDFMVETLGSPDFVLWGGDAPPSTPNGEVSQTFVLEAIQNVTLMLSAAFEGVPIVPIIGNHDTVPRDWEPAEPGWLLSNLTEFWSDWLPDDALKMFAQTGFYSVVVRPGLRVAALNTNLVYGENKQIPAGVVDPLGQFQWLESVLDGSRASGERVIILAHVPPGPNERAADALAEQWSSNHSVIFEELVGRYSDVIVSTHFGHEHSDSFRVFHSNDGTPAAVGYIAPALTPKYESMGNNPGFRLFEYSRSTLQVTDFTQYFIDVLEANALGRANWHVEYRARDAYELADMTPAAWDGAARRMRTDDALFQRYFHILSVGLQWPRGVEADVVIHTCAMLHPTGPGFEVCIAQLAPPAALLE